MSDDMKNIKTMYLYAVPGSNAARRGDNTTIIPVTVKEGRSYFSETQGWKTQYCKNGRMDVNGNKFYCEKDDNGLGYVLYDTEQSAENRAAADAMLSSIQSMDFNRWVHHMNLQELTATLDSLKRVKGRVQTGCPT